jgi:hypothetical protein
MRRYERQLGGTSSLSGPPMTIGNVGQQGVTRLIAHCLDDACRQCLPIISRSLCHCQLSNPFENLWTGHHIGPVPGIHAGAWRLNDSFVVRHLVFRHYSNAGVQLFLIEICTHLRWQGAE